MLSAQIALKPCVLASSTQLKDKNHLEMQMKFLTSATLVSLVLAAENVLALGGGSKPLPEPGVWALLGIGIAGFAARQFFKKR